LFIIHKIFFKAIFILVKYLGPLNVVQSNKTVTPEYIFECGGWGRVASSYGRGSWANGVLVITSLSFGCKKAPLLSFIIHLILERIGYLVFKRQGMMRNNNNISSLGIFFAF